jgi:hypothetical protein
VTLGAVAGTDFRLKIRLSVGIVPPRRIESAESGFPAVDDSDQVVENTLYDGGMNRLNRISSNSEASTNVGQTVETVAKISSDETALNRTVSEGSKKERQIRRDFVSTPQPAAASPESQVLDSLAVEQEGAQQSPQVADARSRLWSEGRARLQDIMDVDDGAARRLLGQLRKFARDDCELVLDVLDEAWDRRPTDPRAWLVTAVKARALQRENTAAGALASVRAWLAAYQAAGAAEDGPGLLSDLLLGGHALPPARASPGAAYGLS